MNEIQEFVNRKLGTVRTVNVDGKIYFIAKDVAICLADGLQCGNAIAVCLVLYYHIIPIT